MHYLKCGLFTLLAISMLTACDSEKKEVLKSPCASAADDGPCGPKRPVNSWWLPQKTKA
jgi:hypothetical protein